MMFNPPPDFEEQVRQLFMLNPYLATSRQSQRHGAPVLGIKCQEFGLPEVREKGRVLEGGLTLIAVGTEPPDT